MDLEELNRQMSFFQSDYNQNQSPHYNQPSGQSSGQPSSHQSVNFPPPLDSPMPTTQVKRPTRTTGTHRNEINDKMVQMKMNQPMFPAPNPFQATTSSNSNTPYGLAQHTRNNSQYEDPNKQHMENLPHLLEQHYQKEQNNPLSAYFQHNFSTLNGIQPIPTYPMQQNTALWQSHHNPNQNPNGMANTHEGGLAFVNPSNLPVYAPPPAQTINQQSQNANSGEKRIDYRQNMNSKVGNFIFDNPSAARYNPHQVAYNPSNTAHNRDTRMVIQDSSKDMYRNEANSRMAQYSPLARASHVPINIANMSVNDFYSSMNPTPAQGQANYHTVEEDARAVLNSRLGAYAPLAKATPLQTQGTGKPQPWENINQTQPLVAYEELPIISH